MSKTKQSDPNKAFHLIQAFMPGEVSHEEAHRIGVELADKLLEGKYSYIVSTHTDKGHVHNHIIFCAADNDELCREHGLSIIEPRRKSLSAGAGRGKSYHE